MLVVIVVFFPLLEVFQSLFLDVIRHPSLSHHWYLHLFYTFSPLYRRVIRNTFILTFLGFSYLPRVLWF